MYYLNITYQDIDNAIMPMKHQIQTMKDYFIRNDCPIPELVIELEYRLDCFITGIKNEVKYMSANEYAHDIDIAKKLCAIIIGLLEKEFRAIHCPDMDGDIA